MVESDEGGERRGKAHASLGAGGTTLHQSRTVGPGLGVVRGVGCENGAGVAESTSSGRNRVELLSLPGGGSSRVPSRPAPSALARPSDLIFLARRLVSAATLALANLHLLHNHAASSAELEERTRLRIWTAAPTQAHPKAGLPLLLPRTPNQSVSTPTKSVATSWCVPDARGCHKVVFLSGTRSGSEVRGTAKIFGTVLRCQTMERRRLLRTLRIPSMWVGLAKTFAEADPLHVRPRCARDCTALSTTSARRRCAPRERLHGRRGAHRAKGGVQ